MSHLGLSSPSPSRHHATALAAVSHDIAWLSHELRTPMTSLKGAIDLLAAGTLDPLPAPLVPLVTIAHRNCGRLAELVDDLIQIGRLEAQKRLFDLQVVEVKALLRQVIAAQPRQDGRAEQRLTLTDRAESAPVLADAPWLARALDRVLHETTHCALPHSHVAVTLQRDGAACRVSFHHHGAVRAQREAEPEDFRLGIAVAHAIIAGHGGTLTHAPRPDSGVGWDIWLPGLAA